MENANVIRKIRSEMKDFQELFELVPKGKTYEFRRELMLRLNWSVANFYFKRRGDTPIWEGEATVIREVLAKYIDK